jgi:hypothetical protein
MPMASAGAADGAMAARRAPPWRDPVLIGAALLWLALVGGLRAIHLAATLPELECVPLDQVALPGEEVEIAARCELRHPSGRIEREGIEIDLRRRDESPGAGRVRSDAAGIARRTIAAPETPGPVVLLADGVERRARSPHPAPAGLLAVLDPARALVVVDAEGLPHGSGDESAEAWEEGVESLAAASARRALVTVAAGRGLVILDASGPRESAAFREGTPWRLPTAVAVLAGRAPEEGAAAFRARTLAEIRRRFGGTIAGSSPPEEARAGFRGVAATPEGCAALVAAGLDVIAVGIAPPAGAEGVASWSAAPERILAGSAPR